MSVEENSRGRQKFAAENATTDMRDVQCLRVTARWKAGSPKNQQNVSYHRVGNRLSHQT